MFLIGWSISSVSDNSCTAYKDTTPVLQALSVSIVQGSAVGPASYMYVVNDLI